MLIYQAYLMLGKKMPTGDDARLFNEGWIRAVKDIPTEELRDAFSDAMASGKPFVPGTVVQSYKDRQQEVREDIRRTGTPSEHPFPCYAKFIDAESGRSYSFALKEPLFCQDCGRPAEAFRAFDGGRRLFFCLYHARIEVYQPSESLNEIPF